MQACSKTAELCAPMDPSDFLQLLAECGFTEAGYLAANPNLGDPGKTPSGLTSHFTEIGLLQRRPIKVPHETIDLLAVLRRISASGIANREYAACLMALMGREYITQKWPTGIANPIWENADRRTDAEIEEIFSYREFGALPYFSLGDSHSRLYQSVRILADHKWLLPVSMTCSGGSARGLINENSNLKYGPRIRSLFERIRPHLENGATSFFKFGQVDVEYVYTYQWSRSGRTEFDLSDFESFIDDTISRYLTFMVNLVPCDLRKRTYICSICPPALADEEWAERYVLGHFGQNMTPEKEAEQLAIVKRMSIPNIRERSQLHGLFNRQLRQAAERAGFTFVDDATQFLGSDGATLDAKFIAKSKGSDVHIDRIFDTISLIEKTIRPLVEVEVPGV